MPAMKHVRFSNINAMYSPVSFPPTSPLAAAFTLSSASSSSTNSLPKSESSSSSSGSKKTRYNRHDSSPSQSKLMTRSRMMPRPRMIHVPEQPIRIHFLLAFSPFKQPAINYDLSISPAVIERYFPSNMLTESATDPPVSSLTITCPYLKWEIPITPLINDPRKGGYVSVSDVLHVLYRGLRMAVHPVEYEALPSMDAVMNVNGAYFKRCGAIPDDRARMEEESKGVKRVDFLMGKNRFLGLSKTGSSMSRRDGSGDMVWELNVSE